MLFRSLDFTRVAEFLFGLRDKYPSAIFCGFGLTYDINCWLASEGLQWIADNLLDRPNGKVCYIKTMRRSLYLEWRPRRTFTLGFPGHPGEGLTIYDVWGFFGAGLVQALREHKIGEPEEWEALEAMKAARPRASTLAGSRPAKMGTVRTKRRMPMWMTRVVPIMTRQGLGGSCSSTPKRLRSSSFWWFTAARRVWPR